jgi:selenocysteine lyase/cysteine desulfurase
MVSPPPQALVDRSRAETPGCSYVIHLNNAGAALMPQPVVNAIVEHIQREAKFGGYESADDAASAVHDAYAAVATLIGAQPRNVAIVENATVAYFQAVSAFDFRRGDVIVTTRNDYISNQIAFLSLAKRQGVEIHRAEDLRRRRSGIRANAAPSSASAPAGGHLGADEFRSHATGGDSR